MSRVGDRLIEGSLFCCASVSLVASALIVIGLAFETTLFFAEVSLFDFFTDNQWTPLFAEKHFGILPLLLGTLTTTFIATAVALPVGLIIAIYLCEFATARTKNAVKPLLELLSGIPSIVFGYFALLVITPSLQLISPGLPTFNALGAGLAMGTMILPLVASLSEDALSTVPRELKEAALALGSTKMQMICRILVPAAVEGIIAAFMLAMGRAIGETMIVAIAAGQQPTLSINPLGSVATMTTYIVGVSMGDVPHGTIEYRTIFAVGAALFIITLVMNCLSFKIKQRFKDKFSH